MWPAPIVILLPFFKRMAGIGQRAEERFIEASIAQLAVKAFDKAVLVGLARRDVVPINACILNLFEDRHAGELSAIVRHNRFWHAAFSNHPIQLSGDTLTRQ